jgi:hypothetical protein
VEQAPKYIVIRYHFLGSWQIGGPVVLRSGTIPPDVLKKYAKNKLPWILRPLFVARVTTSDELPQEYKILKVRT